MRICFWKFDNTAFRFPSLQFILPLAQKTNKKPLSSWKKRLNMASSRSAARDAPTAPCSHGCVSVHLRLQHIPRTLLGQPPRCTQNASCWSKGAAFRRGAWSWASDISDTKFRHNSGMVNNTVQSVITALMPKTSRSLLTVGSMWIALALLESRWYQFTYSCLQSCAQV